ncbi:MAG: SDR family NAD(P)-dependent oxidoreductase [Sphingobium sp.]
MTQERENIGSLIIGASGGLGEAIARRLAADGNPVLVSYRTRPAAAEAVCETVRAGGGRAELCQVDLTDAATVEAAAQKADELFGGLSSVIFASGPDVEQNYLSRLEPQAVSDALDADVIGFFNLVKAALPIFRRQRSGAFVALSSIAVHRYLVKDILGAIPKAGVEALCRGISVEEGRYGIRANSVSVGIIAAGLGKKFMDELYTPEIWDSHKKDVALRRFGTADEVAEAVGFLASERARYITGQCLRVDGGYRL